MDYIQALYNIIVLPFTDFLFEDIFFYVALFSLVVCSFYLLQYIFISMRGGY